MTKEKTEEKEKSSLVRKWASSIETAGKGKNKAWMDQAQKVIDRYEDERHEADSQKKMNILWANTETLKPAIYANMPKPQVSQRFKDGDAISRQASQILERALEYSIESYDFDGMLKSVNHDNLLPGRGVARVVYKPYFGDEKFPEIPLTESEDGYVTDEGEPYTDEVKEGEYGMVGMGEPYKPKVYEEVTCEHVFWKDYRCGPGRKRSEVPWEAFRAHYDRHGLVDRFGAIGQKVELKDNDDEDSNGKAEVWEIWDKNNKKVLWICIGFDQPLDEIDAPYDLKGFFCSPDPIMTFRKDGCLIPIPEFKFYQDQADEIDQLTQRLGIIIQAVKVAGVYAGDVGEIADLLNDNLENKLIPVPDWAMMEKVGGLNGAISWYPVEKVIQVAVSLYEARERTKQELYEITGISDIIRGSSNAAETATAQRIKGQFASLRLTERQKALQVFARDIIRLKAEVICEHFSAETLQMMTGIQVTPEIMQLLRNDPLRRFKIEIETDSTIQIDEESDKQARVEYLTAVSKFMLEMLPMAQAVPEMAPLLGKMLMFTSKAFRAGRDIEDELERFIGIMEQKAAQPKPPAPDPKMIEAQNKMKMDQQTHQMSMQQSAQEHAQDMQFKQQDQAINMKAKLMGV